ncbi:MAG: carboxy terminal-processing peptidase [Desulfuromonadales bacterium]|nr:carboxy terminal-processing peptidase [Desulfuromonadales bacterium]
MFLLRKLCNRWLLIAVTAVAIAATAFSLGAVPFAATTPDLDQNRTRLLTYILRQQIGHHFSGKSIDNDLSRGAFQLYLKQLDYQKRFLLDGEVRQIRAFENQIDDEILAGKLQLVPLAERLMGEGVRRAEGMVREILSQPFDFNVAEEYETDPEKLVFCRSDAELRERWRKDLKYRVLNRYLLLAEDEGFKTPAAIPKGKRAALEQLAREKVLKQHNDYFTRLHQETAQDQYDRYLNAFARAFDPHTSYMPPQSKEDFDISMRGSLEGIGATLRDDEGYIKVVKVVPGSAADRQGELQADDIIQSVAQGKGEPVDVSDMRLRDVVALIRGKKGSEVRLTVKRAGHKPLVIPIIRDVVVIEESFVKSAVIDDPASGRRYGYIKIPSFYRDFEESRDGNGGRNSTNDVRTALTSLKRQGIAGLLLDLRNNGGGALTDAVGVAGLFIERGPIVQVRSSGGATKVLDDQDSSVEYSGPLIVLVNQFSASASEIVAGALQDYGRAIIVGGEHTHGKGTVQVIMDLDEALTLRNMSRYQPLGALRLTTQKFYRISGESTQYRGIVPDIVLPDRQQNSKFGERYLDFSLPWDTIASVKHADWSNGNDLAWLKTRSRSRVDSSQEFTKIRHVAKTLAERLDNTRQSLQIEVVFKERQELGKAGESPHDDPGEDGSAKNERKGESEQAKFMRLLKEDPYVQEAKAIVADMLSADVPGRSVVVKH